MSRVVDILKSIQNKETYNKDALSRAEEILKAICNNTSITMTARSRYETLLLCLKNKTTTTLTPRTRLEEILVAIINGTLENYLKEKNILSYPYNNTTQIRYGITFTDNGDSSITINGTATNHANFDLSRDLKLNDGVKYYFIGSNLKLAYIDENGVTKYHSITSNSFVWSNKYTFINLFIQITSNQTINNLVVNPYVITFSSELEEEYYKTFGV